MADVKQDAPTVVGSNAPTQSKSVGTSVPQKDSSVKVFGNRKTKVLAADAKVRTLAVKCYIEQLPWGEAFFVDQVRRSDRTRVHVLAIKHDRDIVTDGIWQSALAKPHWHVIMRFINEKHRMRVLQILQQLGIVFRQGTDDGLWMAHGVETIGNFSGYAMYLTHETEEAIRDGKERYDVKDIVSNLTEDEIENVRAGYVRVVGNRKLSQAELVALDKEAYDLGYRLSNFAEWYDAQPFAVRANAKMRVIRESYDRGVEARIAEKKEILRLCVYIQGPPNTGKTYAASKALEGQRVLSVSAGGTGKFDSLRPDHGAIIIDDDSCPNLLNMTDNYVCHPYRRNKNNPAWAGQYFVVTGNMTFAAWIGQCNMQVEDRWGNETRHYTAVKSRFYICHVEQDPATGVNRLVLTSPSTRGSYAEQQARLDMFREFRRRFDATIATYVPGTARVDYSQDVDQPSVPLVAGA